MKATILLMALISAAPAAAQNPPPATALSDQSFDKLRKITMSASKATNLDAPVVKTLALGKDGDAISVKQFKAETARGLYVFTVPVKPASDDVLFSFRDLSGTTYTYLSDSKRTLRAAMVSDADGNRPLTSDEALEGFRNSLTAWNIIAPRVKFP